MIRVSTEGDQDRQPSGTKMSGVAQLAWEMLESYRRRGMMEQARRCCPDTFRALWVLEIRPILLLRQNLAWSAFWVDSHVK